MEALMKLKNFISFWYQRYLLATELYMVEPWEKVVIHIIFGIVLWVAWYFNSNIVLYGISRLRSHNIESIDSNL